MKTLLIVEDEKLIRAGIRTMVQRSGVEVEEILEANNGEKAWEILSAQHVDAVFTDIRMPRMDGIELVKLIHGMEKPPYVVAISGYDDFSYAVEMLRNGVTEYLLKPVERERIQKALRDIDDKIKNSSVESRVAVYENIVRNKPYRVAALHLGCEEPELENCVGIPDGVEASYLVLVDGNEDLLIEEMDGESAIGISAVHETEEEVRQAMAEALEARKQAFSKSKSTIFQSPVDAGDKENPEALSDTARTKRIQLIGTDKEKELLDSWEVIFTYTKNLSITLDEFSAEMDKNLSMLPKIYRNLFLEDEIEVMRKKLETPLCYPDLTSYHDEVMDLILRLNEKNRAQDEVEPTRRKIAIALDYIQENYASDLNMAVVSNYISMNYSLFSYAFKQYTGQNFVNYLKELRLKEARRLLEETDDKIIDVAEAVGYENYKHFLKLFRMEYGVSPTEYRKNMQRGQE